MTETGRLKKGCKMKEVQNCQADVEMIDIRRANRIKKVILAKFTYEQMEEASGINIGTLKRICGGQRDVKLCELEKIAETTQQDPAVLAFGNDVQFKIKAETTGRELFNDETESAYRFIIHNIKSLKVEDIQAIGRQVAALSALNYSEKINKDFGPNWGLDKTEKEKELEWALNMERLKKATSTPNKETE